MLDDDGCRAPVIAHWLRCMGHEAASGERCIDADLVVPAGPRLSPLHRCRH